MIVVTGAAGFIGSNLVRRLNQENYRDILAVDDLTDGTKFANLVDCNIADYIDKDVFINQITHNEAFAKKIKVIFHQGACSTTTEWNGRFMMETNYDYSKKLVHYCIQQHIPFLYASSAATYGNGKIFIENAENEHPINVYGYSKYLFDQYVRNLPATIKSQIVGLRYFNVYGPHEKHKGSMASVAFHLNNQLLENKKVQLFAGCDGYADGEQKRDFIHVDDVADINFWFWHQKRKSGIFNVGTGHSQTFNAVANAIIKWHNHGKIEYIPFPEHLRGRYQSFTEANIEQLRAAGYQKPFLKVEEGVKKYLDWLNKK